MAFLEERKSSRKSILFLVLWSGLVFVGAKSFAVYTSSLKLADHIRDLAVHASMQKSTASEVRAEVLRYARSLDLPIVDNDVRVTRTEDIVQINLDYTVPVKLGIVTWNLHFTPSVESQAYN